MSFRNFLKIERFPTSWCPGCGAGTALISVAKVFEELNFTKNNTVVVSGIGCSGRGAGYFTVDSVHGLHGRALPVAEGIKQANPKLNVIVFSGDGDILSIGGNHLLHCARRNVDITVICLDNEIYGMTGGQKSPTTPLNVKTITSPEGNPDKPLNVQAIIRAGNNFYARTTTFHVDHLKKCIKEAIQHRGFSFVNIKSQCPSNNGRRIGFKTAHEMLLYFKQNFKIKQEDNYTKLDDGELGIIK